MTFHPGDSRADRKSSIKRLAALRMRRGSPSRPWWSGGTGRC